MENLPIPNLLQNMLDLFAQRLDSVYTTCNRLAYTPSWSDQEGPGKGNYSVMKANKLKSMYMINM